MDAEEAAAFTGTHCATVKDDFSGIAIPEAAAVFSCKARPEQDDFGGVAIPEAAAARKKDRPFLCPPSHPLLSPFLSALPTLPHCHAPLCLRVCHVSFQGRFLPSSLCAEVGKRERQQISQRHHPPTLSSKQAGPANCAHVSSSSTGWHLCPSHRR